MAGHIYSDFTLSFLKKKWKRVWETLIQKVKEEKGIQITYNHLFNKYIKREINSGMGKSSASVAAEFFLPDHTPIFASPTHFKSASLYFWAGH